MNLKYKLRHPILALAYYIVRRNESKNAWRISDALNDELENALLELQEEKDVPSWERMTKEELVGMRDYAKLRENREERRT